MRLPSRKLTSAFHSIYHNLRSCLDACGRPRWPGGSWLKIESPPEPSPFVKSPPQTLRVGILHTAEHQEPSITSNQEQGRALDDLAGDDLVKPGLDIPPALKTVLSSCPAHCSTEAPTYCLCSSRAFQTRR